MHVFHLKKRSHHYDLSSCAMTDSMLTLLIQVHPSLSSSSGSLSPAYLLPIEIKKTIRYGEKFVLANHVFEIVLIKKLGLLMTKIWNEINMTYEL